MQKVKTYFLRVMKVYGENDEDDIFGFLIVTELKKLSKWRRNMTKIKIQTPPPPQKNMQIEDKGPQNRRK